MVPVVRCWRSTFSTNARRTPNRYARARCEPSRRSCAGRIF
jgi:hypothetical protein